MSDKTVQCWINSCFNLVMSYTNTNFENLKDSFVKAIKENYLCQQDNPLSIRPDDVVDLRANPLPGQLRAAQACLRTKDVNTIVLTFPCGHSMWLCQHVNKEQWNSLNQKLLPMNSQKLRSTARSISIHTIIQFFLVLPLYTSTLCITADLKTKKRENQDVNKVETLSFNLRDLTKVLH